MATAHNRCDGKSMNRSGIRAREAACDFVRLAVMVDAVICCALQREFSPLDAILWSLKQK